LIPIITMGALSIGNSARLNTLPWPWVRRAFWREYLRLFIFPLGGTTDFGRRL
jgi:hypothetical protein